MEKRVIFVFVVATLAAVVWLSVVNWKHAEAEEATQPAVAADPGAAPAQPTPPAAAPGEPTAAAVPGQATPGAIPEGALTTVAVERPPLYRAVVSSAGATLQSFQLLNPQYTQPEQAPFEGIPAEKLAAGPKDLVTTWSPQYYPFRVDWTRFDGTPEAQALRAEWAKGPLFTLVEQTDATQTWVWPDPKTYSGDLFVERRYAFGQGGYSFDLQLTIHNVGVADVTTQMVFEINGWQEPADEGGMFAKRPDLKAGSCMAGDEVERHEFNKLLKDGEPFAMTGRVQWASVDTRYFTLAALPRDMANSQCTLSAAVFGKKDGLDFGPVTARIHETQPTVVAGSPTPCAPSWLDRAGMPKCAALYEVLGVSPDANAKQLADAFGERAMREPAREAELKAAWESLRTRGGVSYAFGLYVGPKDIGQLKLAGESFTEALDFGMLSFLSVPMLYVLRTAHDLVPSWAIAIVMLTVLVKLLLWPLTHKSFEQMQRMSQLRPEMDKLREMYGSDKTKLNQAMMQLYKTHKVNPIGGCLPMLLQMPVYIALYQTINHAVELFQAPLFGWVHDLSAPDPYFVLPVILGVTMFVQQRLTPTSMDSAQAKMMQWMMPIMFTGFMLFLPSGLVLYIFVNTILSLAQQYALKRRAAA